MTNQQYCLRWNNHQPNFISVFKNLLELEELVDVTLSVDGQHLKAHKVILSACSPYFKQLFSANPCKHPIIIILSDIKFSDLKTVVEFMYCGEINISDEQLPDILEAAEILQVRGLFDPNKKEDKNQGTPTKKKKRKLEVAGLINFSQSNATQQRFEESSDENKSSHTGDLANEHLVEQSCENEYAREFLPLVQESVFSPDVSLEEDINGGSQLDESTSNMHSLSSPVINPVIPQGTVRKRNSKVQQSANFHLALEAVRTGQLGFCKAAKLYGLNNRTLWLEYKKRGYPATRSQPLGLRHRATNMIENTF